MVAVLPGPTGLPGASCAALGVVGAACSEVRNLLGQSATWGAEQVMAGVTAWFAHFAVWLLGQLLMALDASTAPRLDAPWFLAHYRVMVGLAGVLVLPLLLLAIVQSVLRQDWGQLLRSAFAQLPLAMLLTGVALVAAQLLLGVTDALCRDVAAGTGAQVAAEFERVGATLASQGGSTVPLLGIFVGAAILVLGALAIWIELLLRAAAIYVAMLFLPLLLATIVWPAAARLCKVLVEGLVAIILSKLAIVAILSLAAAGVTAGPARGGFTGVLAGGALLLLAAFSPLALLRLVPFAEAAVTQAGHRQGAWRTVLTAGQTAGPARLVVAAIGGDRGDAETARRAMQVGTAGGAMDDGGLGDPGAADSRLGEPIRGEPTDDAHRIGGARHGDPLLDDSGREDPTTVDPATAWWTRRTSGGSVPGGRPGAEGATAREGAAARTAPVAPLAPNGWPVPPEAPWNGPGTSSGPSRRG